MLRVVEHGGRECPRCLAQKHLLCETLGFQLKRGNLAQQQKMCKTCMMMTFSFGKEATLQNCSGSTSRAVTSLLRLAISRHGDRSPLYWPVGQVKRSKCLPVPYLIASLGSQGHAGAELGALNFRSVAPQCGSISLFVVLLHCFRRQILWTCGVVQFSLCADPERENLSIPTA